MCDVFGPERTNTAGEFGRAESAVAHESGDVVLGSCPLVFGLGFDETLRSFVGSELVDLGSNHVCHTDISGCQPQAVD